MANTPVYGWPFQTVGDAPHGADLGEDLALAVEATVAGVEADIAALTSQVAALPKGILTSAVVTSNVGPTSGTTELDLITASAVTPSAANRRLRIKLFVRGFSATVGGDIFQINIKEGSTILAESMYTPPGTSVTGIGHHMFAIVDNPTAAAHTYKATIQRLSGTGTATASASATGRMRLTVEDCGVAV